MPPPPPVLLLFGPTAVGKTEVSIHLAETLGTELVYADSMAVYRGMDVGTAKPTPQERQRVPHHLLDVADPTEEFSVRHFLEQARPIIFRLTGSGKVPIVVGGTGLYLRSLTRGLVDAESSDPNLVRELEALADRHGPEPLYRELQRVDPPSALRIKPGDRRRLVRALSVYREHGMPLSRLQKETSTALPCRFFRLGLYRERAELYGRINERVDRMMTDGLQQETERLMSRGLSRSASQALGYKEMIEHLEGRWTLEETVDRIKARTRRLAKRQLTWFRKEPGVSWLDITGQDSPAGILELVSGFLVELLNPWLTRDHGAITT